MKLNGCHKKSLMNILSLKNNGYICSADSQFAICELYDITSLYLNTYYGLT